MSTFSFKRVAVALIEAVAFAAIVALCVPRIGGVYSAAKSKNTVNRFTEQRFKDFYALPEHSLDMAFVGSSHSYCTFDPSNFDERFGISSFQLGTPSQLPDSTYYSLLKMYETQTPAVVVVEIYWKLLEIDFDDKQAQSLFDYMGDAALEADFANKVFPVSKNIMYSFDIFRYRQDYFQLRSKESAEWIEKKFDVKRDKATQTGKEYYLSKGYVYCDHSMLPSEFGSTNQFAGIDGKNFDPSPKQLAYLTKIDELCRKNGSSLVFVTAPIADVSLSLMRNYRFIHDKIAAVAAGLGVPYVDYNMPSERPPINNDNFRDDAHLNDSGVRIVDKIFGDYLSENGFFTTSPRDNDGRAYPPAPRLAARL